VVTGRWGRKTSQTAASGWWREAAAVASSPAFSRSLRTGRHRTTATGPRVCTANRLREEGPREAWAQGVGGQRQKREHANEPPLIFCSEVLLLEVSGEGAER